MPNTTGGKNYKKSKHSSGSFAPAFIERQPDQLYARIVKILGSLNLLAYCNDNKTRICHIRGSMRKKVWINIGDLVLISVRDFEKDLKESGKDYERADIVAKYDPEHLSKLKKIPDINQKLFLQLETADGVLLKEIGKREDTQTGEIDDLGIEFDYSEVKKEEASGEKKDDGPSDSDKEVDIDDI
jgi:translation initiation factor 1A